MNSPCLSFLRFLVSCSFSYVFVSFFLLIFFLFFVCVFVCVCLLCVQMPRAAKKATQSLTKRGRTSKQVIPQNPIDPKKVDAKTTVASRPYIQERSFDPLEGNPFWDTCQSLGLGVLLDWRKSANLTLVRRYYAHRIWKGDVPIKFRSLQFQLHARDIRNHLQLPEPTQHCFYQAYLRDPSSISDETLVGSLCLPGVPAWVAPYKKKRYIRRNSLTPNGKMWLHLVTQTTSSSPTITRATSIPRPLHSCFYCLRSGLSAFPTS